MLGSWATTELMGLADRMAQDLLDFAAAKQISGTDLLMAVSITQQLLQRVLGQSMPVTLRVQQEAWATYKSVSSILERN